MNQNRHNQIIVVVSSPGAGKEETGKSLVHSGAVERFVMSDLIAKERGSGSGLAAKLAAEAAVQASGNLVSDELVCEIARQNIFNQFTNHTQKDFWVDGFPRTITQAEKLLVIYQELSQRLQSTPRLTLVHLSLPEIFAVRRMIKRGRESKEVVYKRIEVYKQETLPVLSFLKSVIPHYVEVDTHFPRLLGNPAISIEAANVAVHKALDYVYRGPIQLNSESKVAEQAVAYA